MSTQDVAMPVHVYRSPNGEGLCGYESGGKTCGHVRIAFVHMLPPEQRVESAAIPESEYGAALDPAAQYAEARVQADTSYETYHGAHFPVDYPPTTAQVVAMFHDAALRLAVSKDQAYRRAWVEQGYIGNVGRILSKASRLRAMAWRDDDQMAEGSAPEEHEETLRDTLLDMANLCAFAAHNLAKGNRWGGDRG